MHTYVSAYALDRFEQCPRKFALSTQEELYWPAPGDLELARKAEVGTRFHQWVQWHALGRSAPVPEDLGTLVRHFLASPWAKPAGRVLSEWDFFVEVGGIPLRGRFDRLQQQGDQWWIVDWKTGKYSDEAKQRRSLAKRWQHRLYPLALVLAGASLVGEPLSPERVQMVYYYPEIGQELFFPYDSRQMQATIGKLNQLAPNLDRPLEAFPKKDRDFCEKITCSYLSACYPDEKCTFKTVKAEVPLPQFK